MNPITKNSLFRLKKNTLLREYIDISNEFVNLKKKNKFLRTIYRNESYFQIFLLILECYVDEKKIYESYISKHLHCSKLTTQKYLGDFYESGIVILVTDKLDKRKKNIIFTEKMLVEISKIIKFFSNRVDFKGF
jgi:hypothetical protein|tara:strand:- start:5274 stop:5675 length:402 start_codon:yes stop_codon:yes gene_type:complete